MHALEATLGGPPRLAGRTLWGAALRHRWGVLLSVFAATVALAAALLAALPKTWQAEVVLRAEAPAMMAALGNPERAVPFDPEEPTRAAREAVLARANLLQLVKRTDLLARWKRSRAPLARLRDAVAARVSGPESEEDAQEELVDLLEKRLYITSSGPTLRIGIGWPDASSAVDLVEAAQAAFLETRAARETAVLEEAIAILGRHADEARRAVESAVDDLAGLRPPATARVRPAPAAANSARAKAELLLAARREALDKLESDHRMRVAELESRLSELRATYADQHPEVRAARESLETFEAASPELAAMREEAAALARALPARAGPRPARTSGPLDDSVERLGAATREHAQERLRSAIARQDQLLGLLDAARIELEIARVGFKYRYEVVRPARLPRSPVRTQAMFALALAAAAGLLLGLFAAAETELRRGPLSTSAHLAAAFPLRGASLGFLFLMLAMPAPGDASDRFRPFWAPLGYLLNFNLNYTLPIPALRFTGADLLLAALLAVAIWRSATGGPAATAQRLARPLLVSALASLCALLLLVAIGFSRGGDGQQTLWQCHQLAFLPLALALFAATLRIEDLPALGRVVLAAALIKAALALWVRYGLGFDADAVPTATSHGDSLLFSVGICLLAALFAEERSGRSLLRALLLGLPLLLAIRANNRRLAWVEVAATFATLFLLLPRTCLKRLALRSALVLLPLGALYLGAGWSSSARVFGPVARIRSIVDSDSNRSTAERDVENYNLVRNVRDRPLFGMGFGHEYTQYSAGDDLSEVFPQWRFIPHNSVLGLLAMGGLLGFFGIWQLLTVGLFLAGRAYQFARAPMQRAAALTAIGAVLAYFIQCYGDMGFVSWASVFLLAPALAMVGQIALASGAWPGRSAPR